jgi:predicted site-specific integrase-resolvase
MKLSQWAKKNGICYLTALTWFHAGQVPNSRQTESGTILVDEVTVANPRERICLYARVSNQSRKKEIQYQIDRIVKFTNERGLSVDKIYQEIASGMNDNRKELWKMLDSNPSKIVVEHKDRLTRFGFNYLEKLLKKQGCEILVMNKDTEDEKDLMKDFIAIVTSFCCRLYGLRRGQNKAKKLKEELKNDTI